MHCATPTGHEGQRAHAAYRRRDTLGLLLVVVVTAASGQDRDGGPRVLGRLRGSDASSVAVVWAGGGNAGRLVGYARQVLKVIVDIVRKREGQRTVAVLPRRWFVEPTLSWISRRRLTHDFQRLPEHGEVMVQWGIVLMARRPPHPAGAHGSPRRRDRSQTRSY